MLTNQIDSIPMKAIIFYICTPDGRNISSKQNLQQSFNNFKSNCFMFSLVCCGYIILQLIEIYKFLFFKNLETFFVAYF